MRWALALQEFSIVFQYYPGRKGRLLVETTGLTTMNGQYRIVQLIFVCICTSAALIVFWDHVYNVAVWQKQHATVCAATRSVGL